MRQALWGVAALCAALWGCPDDGAAGPLDAGADVPSDMTGGDASDVGTPDGTDGGGQDLEQDVVPTATTCTEAWAELSEQFAGVDPASLDDCSGSARGAEIAGSLMNLAGLTIDNNGEPMEPCIEVRCSSSTAYVIANALPHYDFVQTTPNDLVEGLYFYRVPLTPTDVAAATPTDDAATLNGCADAYDQYLANAGQATNTEPSELCQFNDADTPALTYVDGDGNTQRVHKIACLNTIAFVINGSPVFGPNEGPMPDPWGTPAHGMPATYDEPYVQPNFAGPAVLDLCGGHTAATMHYHAVNQSCFERDPDGKPANSYVDASMSWDMQQLLEGDCAAESPIVGWSPDGYPIKGPCVCVSRDGDGSCTEVRRARSSWAYTGLGRWGDDAGEAAALGTEMQDCTSDDDCCGAGDCHYQCAWSVFDDAAAPGGTTVARRCVLNDYSWCIYEPVARASSADDAADFVYMDMCNGFDGPDGYAYHATASFPYIQACYRGEPLEAAGGGGGGPPGGGPPGGGPPP